MGQEFPSDYGLQAYYSCDTLPEIPDNAAGTTYLQDAWATTDSWTSNGGSPLDVATYPGVLYCPGTGFCGFYAGIRFADIRGMVIRIKIKATSVSNATLSLYYNSAFTSIKACALTTSYQIFECYVSSSIGYPVTGLRIIDTTTNIQLSVDWIYIGSGRYDTLLADNSGNARNATVYAACPQPGISGNGIAFNSGNSSVTVPSFAWSTDWSISAWVSPRAWDSNYELFSRGVPAGQTYEPLRIYIASTTGALTSFSADTSTTRAGSVISTNGAIKISSWTHVSIVRSGTNILTYINGVLNKITAVTLYDGGASAFYMGSRVGTTNYWFGILDEMRIYSRALSADEVFLLYTNIVRPVYSPIAPSAESSSTQASIFVVNSTASGFALTSTIDNYENLLYERSMAGIGKFQFSMLADAPQSQYVQVNSYIIIAASYGQPQARVGIILSVDRGISSDHKKVLNVTGFEAKGMFSWRIFEPTAGSAYFTGGPGPAEDVFKLIAMYHGGPSSIDTSRAFYGLSVASALGRGGSNYVLSERYTNVSAVMERLALADKMGWTVSWTGSGLLFDVIVGKDRTLGNGINTLAILSTDFDTVRESHLVSDQTAYKSLAYVGGQGAGTSRVIQTRYTGAGVPTGIDRKEIFIDARDLDTTTKLDARGDEVLASVVYTSYTTAIVNPNSLFVKSSGASLGDYITVQSFGNQMTSQIVGITEQWGANGYEIEYALDKKPNTLTTVISNEAGKLNRLSTGMEV